LFDNASNLLTNFLAGGNFKDMPVVKGDVTDLLDWLHFLFLWLDFVIILMFQKNPKNYRIELPLSEEHDIFLALMHK
jgi:hypothetical protein